MINNDELNEGKGHIEKYIQDITWTGLLNHWIRVIIKEQESGKFFLVAQLRDDQYDLEKAGIQKRKKEGRKEKRRKEGKTPHFNSRFKLS